MILLSVSPSPDPEERRGQVLAQGGEAPAPQVALNEGLPWLRGQIRRRRDRSSKELLLASQSGTEIQPRAFLNTSRYQCPIE